MKCEPRGRSFSWRGDDLFHGAGHAAQVGAFHVGVDVDDRLHVVVADGALLGAGDDGGQVAQHLHGPGGAGRAGCGAGSLRGSQLPNGEAPGAPWKCCWRAASWPRSWPNSVTGRLSSAASDVQPVLRSLDGDVVGNAVARIEIEVGAGLEAAAERHQQALRHVLLRQADVPRRACGPRSP